VTRRGAALVLGVAVALAVVALAAVLAFRGRGQDPEPGAQAVAVRRWVEPETQLFGEPVGQLFRQSTGHGGVMCEGCHNSTHAEWPSFRPEDNDNIIALQGTAGPLADCRVCHTVTPTAPGPHGARKRPGQCPRRTPTTCGPASTGAGRATSSPAPMRAAPSSARSRHRLTAAAPGTASRRTERSSGMRTRTHRRPP